MRKALRTKRAPDLDVISCPCGIQLCYRLKCQKCTDITFVNVYNYVAYKTSSCFKNVRIYNQTDHPCLCFISDLATMAQ